jgi:hypothetical protein
VETTRFGDARATDGTYIGYSVTGDGPIDIVVQPERLGTIDFQPAGPTG